MEFKLKFTDFTPEELLGKTVLYEYGSSYGSYNPSQGIRTISKILKDRLKKRSITYGCMCSVLPRTYYHSKRYR